MRTGRLLPPLVAAAIVIPLAAACGGAGANDSAPKLVLDGDSFDLGVVKIGELTERSIDFRNGGSQPLEVTIVKVRPAPNADCGCGVEDYEVQPPSVPPGSSGRLVFRLKAPEGMSGMQDEMLAELASNDPRAPSLTITFKFQMLP